ncbi:ribonuclease III [Ilumatobacter coccineus]|uniref:Ribonuclease 3 n=1 Tax=Ilumatobacter coccineus (strain NBRC 103263 / KCTC 29153 / YM16-304) TaxID=1313172 RepID=A0A6C7E6R7_ILUCY|nr:ribonuclease III [Ilumatobacter coccineus]BAN02181.1 ribonuclease III [Ilumatobacter coccineus YM16-304]
MSSTDTPGTSAASPDTAPGADHASLAAAVGHEFGDPSLLQRALAHRSWCSEHPGTESNERLEFLGDAVLGWAIADIAYRRFDDLPEGQLTDLRKSVVNATALASIAEEIGVGPHLLLGKGEGAAGGAEKPSILSDAFEAILGAVYLDGGSEAAYAMVERHVAPRLARNIDRLVELDNKTQLQELCAKRGDEPPRYELTSVGPDHAKVFTARALVGSRLVGTGDGRSKKAAEQVAAAAACAALLADA